IIALLPTVSVSQSQTPANADLEQASTISVNVDRHVITFTVANSKGQFITSLKKEDFKVYEDDRLQSITNFNSETDLPLSIVLAVDTSDSLHDKLKFEQQAAIDFFRRTLIAGKDKGMVITFDSEVDMIQPFTDNQSELANSITHKM